MYFLKDYHYLTSLQQCYFNYPANKEKFQVLKQIMKKFFCMQKCLLPNKGEWQHLYSFFLPCQKGMQDAAGHPLETRWCHWHQSFKHLVILNCKGIEVEQHPEEKKWAGREKTLWWRKRKGWVKEHFLEHWQLGGSGATLKLFCKAGDGLEHGN